MLKEFINIHKISLMCSRIFNISLQHILGGEMILNTIFFPLCDILRIHFHILKGNSINFDLSDIFDIPYTVHHVIFVDSLTKSRAGILGFATSENWALLDDNYTLVAKLKIPTLDIVKGL